MPESSQPVPEPRLVGVEIRAYKNLRDVWIPWHGGLAFFGVNGSGKTNVLECLALLMGTRRTLDLAAPRIAHPRPGDLALLARPGLAALPWPAGLVLAWAGPLATTRRRSGVGRDGSVAVLDRAVADAAWWRQLGATRGRTFTESLSSSSLPAVLREYLAGLTRDPVLGYRLIDVERSPSDEDAGSPAVVRRFQLTLLAADLPEDIAVLARSATLPSVLSPLRDWSRRRESEPKTGQVEDLDRAGQDSEDEGPDLRRWQPVMSLPDTPEPPAALQWLARSRTSEEIDRDMREALAAARRGVDSLAEVLGNAADQLPSHPWRTWLHESGTKRAHDELQITLPGLSVLATAGDDGFRLMVDPGDGPIELGGSGVVDALEYLSSGERRWVDEALATATQELLDLARLASLQSGLLEGVGEGGTTGGFRAALQQRASGAGAVLSSSAGSLAGMLQGLQPALIASIFGPAAARSRPRPGAPTLEGHGFGDTPLVLLAAQTTVRVFDEPEAHLHPAAQRMVSGAVQRLRARGSNVVIASHSAHFLELPDWTTIHVRRGPNGATVEALPEDWGGAQSLLAKEMGLNRGELLAGINAVLVVEGTHDQRMLSRLYGNELRAAGVAILRMHGTSNLIATVELDLINRYLDVPMIVLLDYTHVDRVLAGTWETSEERKLAELQRSSRRRDKPFTLLGLHRPDVVCYLNEEALRERYPSFPGWSTVLERFEGIEPRPPFKSWLKSEFAVDITKWRRINQILTIMLRRDLPPVDEMTAVVGQVVDQVVDQVPTPFRSPSWSTAGS